MAAGVWKEKAGESVQKVLPIEERLKLRRDVAADYWLSRRNLGEEFLIDRRRV